VSSTAWSAELPLVGAGGEPVDLWRTIQSHGLVDLPPMRIDDEARALEITVPLPGSRPRTVLIAPGRRGRARVTAVSRAPGAKQAKAILDAVAHVLRLDEDLSPFYAVAAADPDLAWATAGSGRLVRSPTVFEEVVKTICTTNCTWSATERMVGALVEHLGEPAPGASRGAYGRAFSTPAAMAAADESFYRDVARTGYRGAYLRSLAADVASGALDLEALGRASRDELPDDELATLLLALPGVGPYAAAHIMMLLGRYSRLVLDSWTRPKYARLNGGKAVKDSTIERRFRRYGPYAGLAFWLVLTRDWVPKS
jgi:3-methyladenine DNA glycosylase/8-oxoguanine DNA glycosylase